ncbi:MAG: hypothetical protein KatS3mg104_3012 [Phycisphaerae bacterium]|nr:MAG: hypothetical protein KatS3mg104_3012 [Phycisphaerae bacterium]
MQEPNSEFAELPPDLMPIHHLLRQAAEKTPFPEPPEYLYHQTLERCLGVPSEFSESVIIWMLKIGRIGARSTCFTSRRSGRVS